MKYKLEHAQSTIHSIQVSRDSFKRQLSKTTTYCKELVKKQENLIVEKNKLLHLLKEREKENQSIQYLGNNITHRMETLKSQLKVGIFYTVSTLNRKNPTNIIFKYYI